MSMNKWLAAPVAFGGTFAAIYAMCALVPWGAEAFSAAFPLAAVAAFSFLTDTKE